jgi:hypothetical protein
MSSTELLTLLQQATGLLWMSFKKVILHVTVFACANCDEFEMEGPKFIYI